MPQLPHVFEVPDDSGFLGIVDPDAYAAFVGEDWTLEGLVEHFQAEMAKRALLLWGTGAEEEWRVEVAGDAAPPRPPAFRRVSGTIRATGRGLLLVNYETLTMAAQYSDVSLPQPHLADLRVDLPSGDYTCEVAQLENPEEMDYGNRREPDFLLRLRPGGGQAAWAEIPWWDD